MMVESQPVPAHEQLDLSIDASCVPVSYVSSLLRVVQAALREVALTNDQARQRFSQRPQPILVISGLTTDGDLTVKFTFADASSSSRLGGLSEQVFGALLDRFSEFVRGLPQRSLWGGAARGSPGRPLDSQLARRMDQLYRELRRSPKATLRFGSRSIQVEGDRMEIM